jgi:hypothetical protein
MKTLQELLGLTEAPYHIDRDLPPIIKMDADTSLEGLYRAYSFLGKLEGSTGDFYFWLGKNKTTARITTDVVSDGSRQRHIGAISFHKHGAGVPVRNELQVHKVSVDEDFQNRNLAMALYVLLARYGFSVVSDFEQANGGKFLWKKLARESDARQFSVRVWDDESQDWVKDEAGVPLRFTGDNLPDESIWDNIDTSKPTTLLVLTHS